MFLKAHSRSPRPVYPGFLEDFRGRRGPDTISIPVSQSLIQLLAQHNSWPQPLRSLLLSLTWAIQKSRLPQLLFKEAVSNTPSGSNRFGKIAEFQMEVRLRMGHLQVKLCKQSIICPPGYSFRLHQEPSERLHGCVYLLSGWDAFWASELGV